MRLHRTAGGCLPALCTSSVPHALLIGLNGSKSIDTFFTFPSSVSTSPQYMTRPFGGHLVYNLRRCCADVIADNTDNRFTRDLMLLAVPYSSVNILDVLLICSPGGKTRLIMLVPFLHAGDELRLSKNGPTTLARR